MIFKISLLHSAIHVSQIVLKRFLTIIFTMPVKLRTRTVWKKKRRFLWLGRVVEKKLQRVTQQKLEMNKETKERTHPTETIPQLILFLKF